MTVSEMHHAIVWLTTNVKFLSDSIDSVLQSIPHQYTDGVYSVSTSGALYNIYQNPADGSPYLRGDDMEPHPYSSGELTTIDLATVFDEVNSAISDMKSKLSVLTASVEQMQATVAANTAAVHALNKRVTDLEMKVGV